MKKTICILVTCFNRYKVTVECVKSIYSCNLPSSISLEVYLLDDSSPDKTGLKIKKLFPQINLRISNKSLFWAGGMRYIYNESKNKKYDFYLLINDDIVLDKNCFSFFYINKINFNTSIIVGTVIDPLTKKYTYGGKKQISKINPLKFKKVIPKISSYTKCDSFNCNFVLIPMEVIEKMGFFSRFFKHKYADIDYGLRAKSKSIPMFVTPGHIGYCKLNTNTEDYLDSNISFIHRFKLLFHVTKGAAPLELTYLLLKYSPIIAPFVLLKLFFSTLLAVKS